MRRIAIALLATIRAKLECLYSNFGDGPAVPVGTTFLGVSGKLTNNIVRVGMNYKFF